MRKKTIFITIASCLMILLLSVGCAESKREPLIIPQSDSIQRQDTENSGVHSIDNAVEILPTIPDSVTATITEEPKKSLIPSSDGIIRKLFDNKQSGVQVQGSGIVTQILSDDTDGVRHQRFILKLNSGQTLLIAHNIDVAPRLEGVSLGTKIAFYGEYYYNDQGGGIHWTHPDPNGKHVSGYLNVLSQPLPLPRPTTNSKNYIGNKNSQVLHVPTCDSLPYEQNRIFFGTIDEALKQGYSKHYKCMGN
jgi:hypothetical protein